MTVDKEKIRQKLQFMRQELRKLKKFQDMNFSQFETNSLYEAAATRMLQVTIEAMLDICAHLVAREGWGLPKTYVETIELVARHGLIPPELIDTYKAMARFRNRVVHLYDEVNSAEIWNIIQNHLEDFKPFIAGIIQRYLSE
ncbi:MAG: type VII toxin-antitoxin system HepT family RNase toxin [Moorellaceae bacterium]